MLNVVHQAVHSFLPCAVSAAEKSALAFNTVANDPAMAAGTDRSEFVDSALEGVEDEILPIHGDFKTLVIGVSAAITGFHNERIDRRRRAISSEVGNVSGTNTKVGMKSIADAENMHT